MQGFAYCWQAIFRFAAMVENIDQFEFNKLANSCVASMNQKRSVVLDCFFWWIHLDGRQFDLQPLYYLTWSRRKILFFRSVKGWMEKVIVKWSNEYQKNINELSLTSACLFVSAAERWKYFQTQRSPNEHDVTRTYHRLSLGVTSHWPASCPTSAPTVRRRRYCCYRQRRGRWVIDCTW